MSLEKYSDGMLEVYQNETQHELVKARKRVELLEQQDQQIQDEIRKRLKQNINDTIKKVYESGEQSFS